MKFVSRTESQINCSRETRFRYLIRYLKEYRALKKCLAFIKNKTIQKKTVQNNHQNRFVSVQVEMTVLMSLR